MFTWIVEWLSKLMKNILVSTNIKHDKIWLTKDKYIYRATLGEHWYLKKFLVLYRIFLVDRNTISEETYKEIAERFNEYVSFYDAGIKDDAIEYFFTPVDFNNPENIIDFETFNDVKDKDDAARKYYIIYLMKIGMQAGIKKAIGDLLYSTQNITISEILEAIPKIQKDAIAQKKIEGKIPRSVKDSPETIFSDFHAEIRNYRQLLSYRGILPPEEDGYELNEIGKLIYYADPLLMMAIWEHQKIKMRYNNPYTRPITPENPEINYTTENDFIDFSVNPYIALIDVLHSLFLNNPEEAYLSFEDYKYFICREAPFNTKKVVAMILQFRKSNEKEKERLSGLYGKRPKKRFFSKKKSKTGSEDFLKELSNFIYGIFEYQYTKGKDYYVTLLKYENQKLKITNTDLFVKFSTFLLNTNKYLDSSCSGQYKRISAYCSLKMIDEIYSSERKRDYINILTQIREAYLKKYDRDLSDFYEQTLTEWKYYISYIDYKLLIFTYASLLAMKIKDNPTRVKLSKLDINIPKLFIDIVGIEEKQLRDILINTIISFHMKDDSFLDLIDNITLNDTIENSEDIKRWIDERRKSSSYSVIKQIIKKEENDLAYSLEGGSRTRIRNIRMMLLVGNERIKKQIIMEELRPDYPVDRCDSCNEQFREGEPECHHIIPFEIYGPESPFNYAFLCNKCHVFFTHKTFAKKKRDLINKLKVKGIVKKRFYEKMIHSGELRKEHLSFLLKEGFIHIVDRMKLIKMIDATKINDEILDFYFKRKFPSAERWGRAMKEVFLFRIKFKLIMEELRPDYPVDRCDSCNEQFREGEPECHHIIPKQKLLMGPESPFNYAYLCITCHKQITHKLSGKNKVIVNLIKNKIVSFNTVYQMLIADEIEDKHLQFLVKESLIEKPEYDKLMEINKEMIKYQTINSS